MMNLAVSPVAPANNAPERQVLGLRFKSLTLKSGVIAYVEQGMGPTILLLHGAPLTSLGFLRVIRELSPHYRVIAPDLPGFGQSQESMSFSATLDGYASFVHDFCAALGLSDFYLYLNDSSACFGLAAAAELAPQVAGVVVASTVPLPLTGRAWFVKLALKYLVSSSLVRSLNRRFNLLPWLVACVAPWLKPFSAEERRVLTTQFDTAEKRDRVIDLFAAMGHDEAFMQRTADRVRARLAQTPALLLYGQFDPMRFVGGISRYRVLFPRSTIRIISFEEHFPILASGKRVGEAVHHFVEVLAKDRRGLQN